MKFDLDRAATAVDGFDAQFFGSVLSSAKANRVATASGGGP